MFQRISNITNYQKMSVSAMLEALTPAYAGTTLLSTPSCVLSTHTDNVWSITTALFVLSHETFVWFDCGKRLFSSNKLLLCTCS